MTRRPPRLIAVAILITACGVSISTQPETVAELRAKAEQGDAEAQYEFGCLNDIGCLDETVLSTGLDLEIDALDYAAAVRWYRLAAEQGNGESQFNLGVMYDNGEGVPQDYAAAVRWYRRAAAQGFAEAQVNLGITYAIGRGVPRDYVEAHMWLNLASAQLTGSDRDSSVETRDRAAREMTAGQLAEAQRRAREWTPTPEP